MTGDGLRIVLVGLGARSRYWLDVIEADPEARVVALMDPVAERREAAGARCPGAALLASLDEIAGVEADAVLLATPPGGRAAQIEAACRAGLAILAEKPLADTLAEAARHVATAEAAGVPLMVGLNFRYLAVTEATRRLFASEVGRPAFSRFTYERWRDGHQAHLNKYPLEMAQPMLWEQSIHHLDLLRHVYGAEPVRIYARTFNPPWSMYRDDANVSALVTFGNGIEVNYQGTWAANWRRPAFEWRHECERGVVLQRDQFGDLSYARRDDERETPVPLPPYRQWIDDAAALLVAFRRALAGETALPCSGADHLRSLRMVEACILSSRSGQAIQMDDPRLLPPVADRMPHANPTA
jgi:predicted dehydrogenase